MTGNRGRLFKEEFLTKGNPVFLKQLAVFILETLMVMMCLLTTNILCNFSDLGMAYRKRAITVLPGKALQFR